MRILILTNYFPPEGGSGARLVGELAAYLARSGDSVQVLCPRPSYHVTDHPVPHGVEIVRRGAPLPHALPHLWRRGLEHLLRPLALATVRGLAPPDVVYAWFPPPVMAPLAVHLAEKLHAPLVLHVQDLFPFNAIDTGALPSPTVGRFLERTLRPTLARASTVLVHAPSAAAYFAALGRVTEVVPNWVSLPHQPGDGGPHQPGDGGTHQPGDGGTHQPGDGGVEVLFAGVLGLAQDGQVILDAAERLRDQPEIRFTLVGDGAQSRSLAAELEQRRLPNVVLRPMVPPGEYRRLVDAADLFLVTLRSSIRYPVIPSKIGDAMAAGKALVAALPDGDGAALVRSSGAGLVVPAGDGTALAQAIASLAADPARRRIFGHSGQTYAATHLAAEVVLPRLRSILTAAR